jgi:catalase
VRLPDTDHSLKAGPHGPSLLEDFHLREKITHFDHERIPERVVHARGAAAHGVFESYGTASDYTRAAFLARKGKKTDVFCRFSTVLGSRGSADTVRNTRGFAVKFCPTTNRVALSARPRFSVCVQGADFANAPPSPHTGNPHRTLDVVG